MCWICIGVPPAMEDAECLERLFHVDNRANHIKGKWFKKDVLASIASILQVTGAQAIQCESISKDKNSGTGNSIGGPFHTDPGSLYIMSCKFNSKQLKICEDIYNSGITEAEVLRKSWVQKECVALRVLLHAWAVMVEVRPRGRVRPDSETGRMVPSSWHVEEGVLLSGRRIVQRRRETVRQARQSRENVQRASWQDGRGEGGA